MSHPRTTVSASVIKTTSRFAPKAVPRKPQIPKLAPPKSTPAPTVDEDESESENEIEDEIRSQQQEEDEEINQPNVGRRIDGIPTIQSSLPTTITYSSTAIPISIPTTKQIISLPTALPTEPPESTPTPEYPLPTTSTRKRRTQTTSDAPSRRRRRTTPPTAEEVVIVPSTAKMSEMCVDKRTGRKSARYAELREAERQRKRLREIKREQERAGLTPAPESPSSPTRQNEITEEELVPLVEAVQEEEEEDDSLGPITTGTARVMTDENGNIILDQSSLQVDRHEIHPSTLTESLVHTTETIFSSKTNSATYASTRARASNTIRWLPEDNERFYTALRMFGTDFGMIATYLGGGKQRRHVKNKFYREERTNSDKLTWALKNRLEVDVAGLEEKYGTKFKNMEEMREELEGLKAEAALVKALPPLSESQNLVQNQSSERGPGRSIIAEALDREYE